MRQSAILASIAVLALVGCGGGSSQQDAAAQDGGNKLIGQSCDHNGDCKSVQCLTDDVAKTLLAHDVYTHGGYCIHFPCDSTKNDADCGEGAHCFNGEPYGATMWICLKTCNSGNAADCGRSDYECFEDIAGKTDAGVTSWGCIPVGLIQFDGGVQDDAAAQTD